MEHIFIADTNLFFECKRLEELPWSELGIDPVVIALTKPVNMEIDKHKNGGGRTRRRALDMSQRIRGMLQDENAEEVIQQSGPRVVLRLLPIVRPDPDLAEVLDYTHNDDRIVGIVSAMTKATGGSVSFLTDDGVAASTAQTLGLPFILIPESWKRPPEETTEAKQIKELKKDLALYRAQEPSIELRNADGESETRIVRRVPVALGQEDIDRLVETLRARHPMQESFAAPEPETRSDGTEVSFEAPDEEAIGKYKNEAYPQWLQHCRLILAELHKDRVEREPTLILTVGVANSGTRPASRMRISFEAQGKISLRRTSNETETPEEGGAASLPSKLRPMPRLPMPPSAPPIRRIVKQPHVPAKLDLATLRVSTAGLRISDLTAGASALKGLTGTRSMFAEVERMASLADAMRLPESMASVLRAVEERNRLSKSLFGGMQNFDMHLPQRHFEIPTMPMHNLVPPKRDPEDFYYEGWPPGAPVTRAALTCEFFRHQGVEELFEFEVLFADKGDATGAVLCTVHAENLTEPVELRIPVSRRIETFELLEAAEAMIADCR